MICCTALLLTLVYSSSYRDSSGTVGAQIGPVFSTASDSNEGQPQRVHPQPPSLTSPVDSATSDTASDTTSDTTSGTASTLPRLTPQPSSASPPDGAQEAPLPAVDGLSLAAECFKLRPTLLLVAGPRGAGHELIASAYTRIAEVLHRHVTPHRRGLRMRSLAPKTAAAAHWPGGATRVADVARAARRWRHLVPELDQVAVGDARTRCAQLARAATSWPEPKHPLPQQVILVDALSTYPLTAVPKPATSVASQVAQQLADAGLQRPDMAMLLALQRAKLFNLRVLFLYKDPATMALHQPAPLVSKTRHNPDAVDDDDDEQQRLAEATHRVNDALMALQAGWDLLSPDSRMVSACRTRS